jgi:DNA-binding CsgD family transcriptional regulator
VYVAIPAPMRGVLHRAAADRVQPSRRPHHLVSAGAPAAEVLADLTSAMEPLGHAPAVEADVLDEVVGAVEPDHDTAGQLAVRRARALARSGQFRRAQEVAQAALPGVRDPAVYSGLMRVVIFSHSTRADIPGVMKVLDETLQLPLSDRVRRVVSEHRALMSILGGTGPVPDRPLSPDPMSLTINGLGAEVLRTYLVGDLPQALEYAWEASRRLGTPDVDADEGGSADIWPPIVELMHHGPEAARTALREVVRLREERGEHWQTAPHQLVEGSIEMQAGRLPDAAATLDTGLELAATVEMGWVSQAVGIRAQIDVVCGALAEAEARLDHWEAEERPRQFGQPQPALARVLLLEAQRRYDAAAELALTVWKRATSYHLRTWMVPAAPELCRVAVRAASAGLLAAVGEGLRDVRRPPSPAAAPALRLAEAMVGDPARLAREAGAAADGAQTLGDRYVELLAREEAAVATAVLGDRKDARQLAARALTLASDCGADGVAARISGRLRAAGVRLGSTAPRSRPTSGWESLTPTEKLVVEQVAAGRTGPEIAQRLNISPRTVQTHVSHVLTKLGLSHRVELAAAAAARSA